MNLEREPALPAEAAGDYAYRVLRRQIMSLGLIPGEGITENAVAERLGVSRTPVRAAFSRLVAEKLLEIYPQRGTFVSKIDLGRVEEAKFMRLSLEQSVMGPACRNFSAERLFALEENLSRQAFSYENGRLLHCFDLDNELHGLIFQECGLNHVWEMIRLISTDYDRVRTMTLTSLDTWEPVFTEHRAIIEAIRRRDEPAAAAIIRGHISRLDVDREIIRAQFPGYFL